MRQPPIARATRTFASAALLASAVTLYCGLMPASATPDHVPRASEPFNVSEIHCNFVDASRSVPDYATQPPSVFSKVRPLPTTIWLPSISGRTQPRPLVLFAAGYDSYPGVYAPLLSTWARAGIRRGSADFP